MSSRRSFLKGTGAAAAAAIAVAGAGRVQAATAAGSAPAYNGPHEMPRNVTLLAIRQSDGADTLGAKTAKGVVDVRAASAALNIAAPLTLSALLREGNAAGLAKLIQAAETAPDAQRFVIDESKINHGRLFTNPSKIVCVGLNYRRHAQEIGAPIPKKPVLFNKYNNTLAAHNCTIKLPPEDVSYKFDYETELLIVIGKHARNVSEADALNYIAGYCTSNDFSSRDLQLETGGQWMIGKTLDDFAPIGPYFVSADLVGDPNKLKIETRVNGEVRQSSNTSDFIFNTQQMIAYITKHFALEPGDIIFTGTPEGVILGYPKEKQVWLKPGDEIVSSIEKLGELKFKLA